VNVLRESQYNHEESGNHYKEHNRSLCQSMSSGENNLKVVVPRKNRFTTMSHIPID